MGLSICFVGTGAIVRRHIRIVRRLRPDARLSVASRDPARGREFADAMGIAVVRDGYDAAVAADDDVLVVGTPPRGHAAIVDRALTAGKHLLIEKPAFSSFAELVALWPRLVAHPRVVMVAENIHFDPFHRRIRDVLASGDLGRPVLLEIDRLGSQTPSGWRADPEEMPLGALHEGGVHWIRRLLDLASAFEPDGTAGVMTVTATGRRLGDTPGEDTTVVVARHRSGLMSRLLHSWALPKRSRLLDSCRIILEKGAVYFDPGGALGTVRGVVGRQLLGPRLRDIGGYVAMWRSFLASVDDGRPVAPSLAEIHQDFAYLDAAYRSMRSGIEETPAASS